MVEENGSKSESKGEQPKDERKFNKEQCDRHGRTRTEEMAGVAWAMWRCDDREKGEIARKKKS